VHPSAHADLSFAKTMALAARPRAAYSAEQERPQNVTSGVRRQANAVEELDLPVVTLRPAIRRVHTPPIREAVSGGWQNCAIAKNR